MSTATHSYRVNNGPASAGITAEDSLGVIMAIPR